MKKLSKIVVLTLAMVVLFAVYALSACGGDSDSGGGGGKANEKIQIASKMFTNFHVDLSDSKGLGIAERDKTKTKDKNYMVSLTEDGILKDVVFLSESNDETTQEEINGCIVKLNVTEKFTFMMFQGNFEGGKIYEPWGYSCNQDSQSFVIDNATGKIYSLEELCVGTSNLLVKDDYVEVHFYGGGISKKYYGLSIQNGNLVVADLSPSPAIEYEENIILDKFGNYYVGINSVDEQVDNVFYYKFTDDIFLANGVHYGKGNDGCIYKISMINDITRSGGETTIKKMSAEFKELDLEPNDTVTITVKNEYNEITIIIKEDRMLYVSDYSFVFTSYQNGKYMFDEYMYHPDDEGYGKVPAFLNEEVFYIRDYKLYHYDWLTQTEAFVFDGINNLVTEGTRLYAIAESVTGTKKYQITFENNEAKVTLVSEKTYDRTIITIQPLN